MSSRSLKLTFSEEMKTRIVFSNPAVDIKFKLSQRNKVQMVVGGYVLNKKDGPYYTPQKGVTVYWRCAKESCQYKATTYNAMLWIGKNVKAHNHSAPF